MKDNKLNKKEDGESKEDYRRRVIAWYTQKNLRAKLKEKERATHIFDHLMDERINHAGKILRSQGFSLNEILEGKNIARAAKKSEGMRRIYDQDYRKKIGLI